MSKFVIVQHYRNVVCYMLHTYIYYDIPTIKLFAETGKGDPMKCCYELFSNWLTTDNGLAPKTWFTLIELFKEIDQLSGVAEHIEESLKCKLLFVFVPHYTDIPKNKGSFLRSI